MSAHMPQSFKSRIVGPMLAVLALSALSAPPVLAQEWPRLALPREVRTFDIAAQVALNGAPMRLQGFVSPLPPTQLLEQFRQSLGPPLVESTLGPQRVLGRMQGEFYISVQIEPAGTGSRGTTAVTQLKPGLSQQARQDSAQWLARMTAGSRLLSDMASVDGKRQSRHLVFSNGEGELLNRDRLVSVLRTEGLALEREGAGEAPGVKQEATGRALFFKGSGKEAIATIHHSDGGTTTLVLNLITLAGVAP